MAKARKSKETLRTLSSTVDRPPVVKKNPLFMALILGTILKSFSLLENNFIEYEKSIWIFLWTSICLWIIFITMKSHILLKIIASINRIDGENIDSFGNGIISAIFHLLLFMNRINSSFTSIDYWLQLNPKFVSPILLIGIVHEF